MRKCSENKEETNSIRVIPDNNNNNIDEEKSTFLPKVSNQASTPMRKTRRVVERKSSKILFD